MIPKSSVIGMMGGVATIIAKKISIMQPTIRRNMFSAIKTVNRLSICPFTSKFNDFQGEGEVRPENIQSFVPMHFPL